MDSGLSASDIMALNRDGDGLFGGGSWAIIIILFLLFAGNGFGGRGQGATTQDVTYTSAFNQLQDENRDLNNAIRNQTVDLTGSLNQNAMSILNEAHDMQMAISGLAANQQQCCCETLRAIDGVNANTTANVQKVLDRLAEDKISALEGKIASLELQNALAGVVRYPNGYTYNAGPSPFCGCSQGLNI